MNRTLRRALAVFGMLCTVLAMYAGGIEVASAATHPAATANTQAQTAMMIVNALKQLKHSAVGDIRTAAKRSFNPGDGWSLLPFSSDNGLQAVANGVGAQVTIVSGGGTVWDTSAATLGYKVMPHGNHSHCQEKVGTAIKIENCQQGNSNQWFSFNGAVSNVSIQNVNAGTFTGVFNPNVNNKPVYSENPMSGFFTGWIGPGLGSAHATTTAKLSFQHTPKTPSGLHAIGGRWHVVNGKRVFSAKLCLKSDTDLCINSNGQGTRATIQFVDGATVWNYGSGPNGTTTFTNQNQNCLRAKTDLNVITGNGACNPSGDPGADWIAQVAPTYTAWRTSVANANFMGTAGNQPGNGVFCATQHAGFWLIGKNL
jgi:hypothetical protein